PALRGSLGAWGARAWPARPQRGLVSILQFPRRTPAPPEPGPDGLCFRRIHGIGDHADTWRDLIPELAKDYTVIAPDLLGHGRSDKPRADYAVGAYANGMRDLLSVLDIEQVTVVGHSLRS